MPGNEKFSQILESSQGVKREKSNTVNVLENVGNLDRCSGVTITLTSDH